MATKAAYTELRTRQNDGKHELFDPIRKRWVALTPEEWVRQNLILALHTHYGYPLETMAVEATINLNGMSRRCDLVVYHTGTPVMIAECKKNDVALTQRVCDQACRYNTVLRVPYLLLANGRHIVVLQVSDDGTHLQQIPTVPSWSQIVKK